MKRFLILILFLGYLMAYAQSQTSTGCGGTKITNPQKPINLGIVIYSNDAETVWNAFKLANYSLAEGDSVSIFLLGKGVEAQTASTKDFDVKAKMEDFSTSGGKIYACGTCLTLRHSEGSKLCPVSSLSDLYDIVKKSEKVLTF